MQYALKSFATVALGVITACAPGAAVDAADPDLFIVRGYRSADDACKLTGETAFTVNFLDDAADLVSCPTGDASAVSLVADTGAHEVAQTLTYTLYSVPRR